MAGANHLLNNAALPASNVEIIPDLIIGDLDSLLQRPVWESMTNVVRLAEQDTTDFEKCLYSVSAPLFLAFGFTGNRLDHTLAAVHIAAKYIAEKSIILVACLLYTSPSPRDGLLSRMPSSA